MKKCSDHPDAPHGFDRNASHNAGEYVCECQSFVPEDTPARMTPEQRIDEALDSVLRASGSALKHYTTQKTLDEMRKAMRKIMSDSYIAGSNDNFKAMRNQHEH